MQKNNSNNLIQEHEINLIEFLNLLINSKKIIIIITLIFTLVTTGYVYSLKPSYVAKSVVKIGFYTDKFGDRYPIKPSNEVIDDLSAQFIELPKYKSGMSELSSIELVGNINTTEDFRYIVLTANARLPSQAIKKIEIAQEFLKNDHQIIIDKNIKKLELLITQIHKKNTNHREALELLKIKNIDKILIIKKQIEKLYGDLEFKKQDIATQKQYLELYKVQRNEIEKMLSLIDPSSPSPTVTRSIELGNTNGTLDMIFLDEKLADASLTLNQMNNQKTYIEAEILAKEKSILQSENNIFLLEMEYQEQAIERQIQIKLNEAARIESIIQGKNYSNTDVFTGIETGQVGQSKQLLISLGFITGLMLSIFFVFIRQTFLQEQK